MVRYFSGANQHHLNHTFGTHDQVVRAFNHAGNVPYAIGCILSPPKDPEDRQKMAESIENYMLVAMMHADIDNIEDSPEHYTVVELMVTASTIWVKKLELEEHHNAFGEELQLGYMLLRYQDLFGRNNWSFMTVVYHGKDWLQTEEQEVLPVLLSVARLT